MTIIESRSTPLTETKPLTLKELIEKWKNINTYSIFHNKILTISRKDCAK